MDNPQALDGVRVSHAITIRESLVFPGVTLTTRSDIERRIITAEHAIDCR